MPFQSLFDFAKSLPFADQIPALGKRILANIAVVNDQDLPSVRLGDDQKLKDICNDIVNREVEKRPFRRSLDTNKYLKLGREMIANFETDLQLIKALNEEYEAQMQRWAGACDSQEEFVYGAEILLRGLHAAMARMRSETNLNVEQQEALQLSPPFRQQAWHRQFSEMDRMLAVSRYADFKKVVREARLLAFGNVKNAEVAAFCLAKNEDDYHTRLASSIPRTLSEFF